MRGVGLLLLAITAFAGSGAVAAQPNILLIYVDDLGYGDLGSFGHPVVTTPNLDRLAASGLKLTNYYAPSALCSPSRAGLLTGRYPYRTGIKSWIPHDSGVYLRDAELTLAEVLRDVGYATALIGKWHLNSDLASETEPQPNDQGFDFFYGHNAFQIPTNRNPINIFRNRAALGTQQGYTAELYASEAIAWLEQERAAPFFLMLSMAEPHTTFENPPQYNKLYADYTRGEIVPIRSGEARPPKDKLVPRGPGEYYANITYMDAQLGRVLDWLAARPAIDANTLIVFASDNGPVTTQWLAWYEVNAHGSTGGLRGRKHNLFEGGIKVPAMIRYPGITRSGSTSGTPIAGTDLFVTLATIGGASVPSDRAIDGIDISPVLQGKRLPEREMFWALPTSSDIEFAVRQGDWKLLLDKNGQPAALYNLAEDPLELFDLHADEPAVTQRLAGTFARIHASIEASAPR